MKFLNCGWLALLFIACLPASAQMTAPEKANVKMVLDWYREVIVARHVELAPKYQAEDYIQHNPNIATGRAAFVKYFSGLGPPLPIPDKLPDPPAVAFGKGNYVVLLWNHSAADGFDCLRIQNGKIQEHWDEARKDAPGPAPAATDLSAQTPLKLSGQEQKNVAIATRELRAGSPTLTIASGPYVFFMWDRKAKDPTDPAKEYTWDHFDLVRVDNGKIQKHWDEAKKNP
jgi:predicted SnoaL-like aldol condensation-catalyzing enzyme